MGDGPEVCGWRSYPCWRRFAPRLPIAGVLRATLRRPSSWRVPRLWAGDVFTMSCFGVVRWRGTRGSRAMAVSRNDWGSCILASGALPSRWAAVCRGDPRAAALPGVSRGRTGSVGIQRRCVGDVVATCRGTPRRATGEAPWSGRSRACDRAGGSSLPLYKSNQAFPLGAVPATLARNSWLEMASNQPELPSGEAGIVTTSLTSALSLTGLIGKPWRR